MTIRFNRHHLIMALIIFILCGKVSAESTTQQYHIPAQPLNSALMRFASDANLELLYTADKLRAFKTSGLNGSMTSEQALSKLLQGSGMTYRFVDAKTVTVEQPDANFRKTANVDEKPESLSGGDTTLPKVTVEADADPYDSYNTADPYNKSYSVTNSTTATKTDTPIMDTPVSIQVVPKAVLRDQQAWRVEDAVKNVSGVQQVWASGGENIRILLFAALALITTVFAMVSGSRRVRLIWRMWSKLKS